MRQISRQFLADECWKYIKVCFHVKTGVFIDRFQWHIYRNLWQSDKNKDETTQTPRNMACVRKSLSKGVQGHDRYHRQKGINTVKYNAVVSQLESRLPINFISTCLSVCFCLSLHHVKVRLRSSFQLRKEKDFMPLKWHIHTWRLAGAEML